MRSYLAVIATTAPVILGQRLDHPPLTDNLDYLLQGNLDNLHPTQSTWNQWDSSTLPQDCKDHASQNGYSPSDMETYNVTYTDCGDPYIMCRHKSSPVDLVTFIDMFGRMPVGMRDWVRTAIALPGTSSAYNAGGTIVFFDQAAGNLDVHLHETGHSLDLQGAMNGFPQGGYSSGQPFMDAYNQDPNVPDNYAQTNIIEDFAQITVVSVYDKVVPGGFGSVQPNWNALFHQYATMQADAGNQIIPGGSCNRHLAPSAPVSVNSVAKADFQQKKTWNNFFTGKYDVVEPNLSVTTKGICKLPAHRQ